MFQPIRSGSVDKCSINTSLGNTRSLCCKNGPAICLPYFVCGEHSNKVIHNHERGNGNRNWDQPVHNGHAKLNPIQAFIQVCYEVHFDWGSVLVGFIECDIG